MGDESGADVREQGAPPVTSNRGPWRTTPVAWGTRLSQPMSCSAGAENTTRMPPPNRVISPWGESTATTLPR